MLNTPAMKVVRGMKAKFLTLFSTSGVAQGSIVFFAATALMSLSNFLFHVIVSRLLGPATYGALGALLNVLLVLSVPLGAFQAAVTRTESANLQRYGHGIGVRNAVIRVAAVGLVATAMLTVAAPVVKEFLHLNSSIPVALLALWIVPSLVGAVLQGVLMGRLKFTAVALATVLGGVIGRLLFGVFLVQAGFGLDGAVIASVLSQVILVLILMIPLAHEMIRSKVQEVGIGFGSAVHSLLAFGGYWVLATEDTVLARHFLSPYSAGMYASASTAGRIVLFLPGAIALLAFPQFARDHGRGRLSRATLRWSFLLTLFIGAVSATILAVEPSLVIEILFGSSYLGAVGIVRVLGIEALALGLLSLLIYFHLARESVRSLYSWVGAGVGLIGIERFHGSAISLALVMLVSALISLALSLVGVFQILTCRGLRMRAERNNEVCDGGDELQTVNAGKRKRILVLNYKDPEHSDAGGAEVFVLRLAEEWVSEGHEVTFFTSIRQGQRPEEERDGILYFRRGSRYTVFMQAHKYMRKNVGRYDLVLDSVSQRGFRSHRYFGTKAVSLVHHLGHELWFEEFRFPLGLIGRYLADPFFFRELRGARLVAVSASTASDLESLGMTVEAVVNPAHDFESVDERSDLPARAAGSINIVFIGRLVNNKRPHLAVEAFCEFLKVFPNARLHILGDGYLFNELAVLNHPNISVYGYVEEAVKRQILSEADLLLVTSVREGWGIVVMEAAAMGVPTVAVDVPGLRDSVCHDYSGQLAGSTPEQLASAMRSVVGNRATWLRYSENARLLAMQLSWSRAAAEVMKIAEADSFDLLEDVPEVRLAPAE